MAQMETNSFEKKIWDAACVLRGNLDASEYKSVVLGLIFLKYISDRFEEKYKALVEEGAGFEEDIDEYTAEGIFFVPANARWGVISAAAHTPEIGTVIDTAMRSIEQDNRRLKPLFPGTRSIHSPNQRGSLPCLIYGHCCQAGAARTTPCRSRRPIG